MLYEVQYKCLCFVYGYLISESIVPATVDFSYIGELILISVASEKVISLFVLCSSTPVTLNMFYVMVWYLYY